MLFFLNRAYLYVLVPVLVQLFFLFFLFNIDQPLTLGVLNFLIPIISISVFFCCFKVFRISILKSVLEIRASYPENLVFISFSFFIVLMGFADLMVNGIKILNPGSYADFYGSGRYIRHFSSLCWMLIPVSVLCIKSKKIRFLFIFYALIFPIIIVDRNRLLLSFYVLIFVYLSLLGGSKNTFKNVIYILIIMLVFSAVGFYRSGSGFSVESSGEVIREGALPLKDTYYLFPSFLKQIFIYITTPIFNFSYVFSVDFYNAEFFLSQISPFSRAEYLTYPYSPVPVKRFNVGTEFFPQLMYGGIQLVWLSQFFMIFIFFISVLFLYKIKNIATLLIFFKISHAILFMGFAPQFYILLNFATVILIAFLWFVSSFLSSVFYSKPTEVR